MSLPIVFIIIICMMGTFALSGIIMMRKSNNPTRPNLENQPVRIYKSGEEAPPK